ncbi:MAG: N-acetylmuramoyl-L-alanine amidase [Planctomycetota bacterium]
MGGRELAPAGWRRSARPAGGIRVLLHRSGFGLALLGLACTWTAGCNTTGGRGTARHITLERGYTALQNEDLAGARSHFQRATEPLHAARVRGQGFLGLARCDLAEGRHEAAVVGLERARTLLVGTPETADVELLLADSCLQLGEFDRARRHLEIAIQYMPDGPTRSRSASLLALLHERDGSPEAKFYRELAGSTSWPEYARWRNRILPPVPEPEPMPTPVKPTPERPRETTTPVAQLVSIHARPTWGAKSTGDNVKQMGKVKRITIHHTGEPNVPTLTSATDVKAYLLRLQKSHQKHKGWADLAYHYLIDPNGGVWEGRPVRFQGAHAGSPSANEGNVGIALIGNFDESEPPRAQLAALKRLIGSLRAKYSLSASTVHTHQGLKKTAGLEFTSCPGRNLLRLLPALLADDRSDEPRARFARASSHPDHH